MIQPEILKIEKSSIVQVDKILKERIEALHMLDMQM